MTQEFDGNGRVISETFRNGNKYIYEYDDKGNLISQTYPSGRNYKFEYDERGNLILMIFPEGDKIIYEYVDIKGEAHAIKANNINPYLVDAPDVLIQKQSTPISYAPELIYGSEPREGGFLIFNSEEKKGESYIFVNI